jgi:hypothetical protein
MLGAFFTPSYRDWWLAYTQRPEDMNPYRNHWLVRKSAAKAFAQGFVKLDRLQPSMVEVSCDRCTTQGLPFFFFLFLAVLIPWNSMRSNMFSLERWIRSISTVLIRCWVIILDFIPRRWIHASWGLMLDLPRAFGGSILPSKLP